MKHFKVLEYNVYVIGDLNTYKAAQFPLNDVFFSLSRLTISLMDKESGNTGLRQERL